MLTRLVAYVRAIAGGRRIDAEAADELAFHLDQETQAHVARGRTRQEARRLALITLGGVAQTLEAVRDVRATPFDRWWRDVRHACRALRATPGFTVVALTMSTLSIGASTAIFSVVDGVVLRPLPFADADRLVAVGELDVRNRSDNYHLGGPTAAGSPTPVTRTNTANRTHQWLRAGLVVTEVACAFVLLVGSGLFIASFSRVASVDLGLDPRDVLTVRVRPLVGPNNWALAQQRNPGLLRTLVEDVRAIAGVEVAALVDGGVPLRGDVRTTGIAIPGRELPRDEDLDFNQISPDYFRAIRVPLLAGRLFTDHDRQGSEPVVIINEAAAQRYFHDEDPVGKTAHFLGVRRIVGVVGNIRHDGPETGWRLQGFVPIDQTRAVGATLVLRLSRETSDVLPAVKAAIWSQFPDLALPDVQTLSGYLGHLVAQRRFLMLLFSLLGLLGAVITCVGIYGVMAYVVELAPTRSASGWPSGPGPAPSCRRSSDRRCPTSA